MWIILDIFFSVFDQITCSRSYLVQNEAPRGRTWYYWSSWPFPVKQLEPNPFVPIIHIPMRIMQFFAIVRYGNCLLRWDAVTGLDYYGRLMPDVNSPQRLIAPISASEILQESANIGRDADGFSCLRAGSLIYGNEQLRCEKNKASFRTKNPPKVAFRTKNSRTILHNSCVNIFWCVETPGMDIIAARFGEWN